MSTKEVFNYVMNTPRNTNPAVLNSMLRHLSWNDLKDKPFYTEIIPTVVLNETLNYNSYEEWYQGNFKDNDLTFTQVGDTYIVQINNSASQEYVLDESMTATYTDATTGKDYNLPFGVEWVAGIVITAADGTTDPIAVKVAKLTEKVHKLDGKYLPDSAIGEKVYYILNIFNENDGTVLTATEGIYKAIQKNIFDAPTGIIVKIIEGSLGGNSYRVFDVDKYEMEPDTGEIKVYPINGGQWAVYYILRENGEITFYDGG